MRIRNAIGLAVKRRALPRAATGLPARNILIVGKPARRGDQPRQLRDRLTQTPGEHLFIHNGGRSTEASITVTFLARVVRKGDALTEIARE
jgi:hypothetical protein